MNLDHFVWTIGMAPDVSGVEAFLPQIRIMTLGTFQKLHHLAAVNIFMSAVMGEA